MQEILPPEDEAQQRASLTDGAHELRMANFVYFLYLAGLVLPIVSLVGLIVAYVTRGDGPDWLQSHFTFQIRTFWIGLLMIVTGALTSFFLVGYLLLLFWFVWLIVRCVKGLKQLSRNEPHPDPTTWTW